MHQRKTGKKEPTSTTAAAGGDMKSNKNWGLLSRNASKMSAEYFFLWWSLAWIAFFGGVVISGSYKEWTDVGYMGCGLILAVPNLLLPNLFPSAADKQLPWTRRFVTKAYIWIGILNFTGNYFWTHYFFKLLGASYSFPVTWKLNEVPIALYLITQSYFTTYFLISNLILRKVFQYFDNKTSKALVFSVMLVVGVVSWFFAFMETWTIESVPYYSFVDRSQMYKVGLTFYALYFVPAFPMFYLLDEEPNSNATLWETITGGLSASMLAFYLVDFWRLIVGTIYAPSTNTTLPFL